MNRAFVKEPDGDDVNEDLPERVHSDEPNYITPMGEKGLREKIRLLGKEREVLNKEDERLGKKGDLQRLERDIGYYQERLHRAIVVERSTSLDEQVIFGTTVTLLDESENKYEFTIVGEDETDLDAGKISWTSALGRALLQQRVDDTVVWKRPAGDLELEICSIAYKPE
jgi:transcription elongation factor GreB